MLLITSDESIFFEFPDMEFKYVPRYFSLLFFRLFLFLHVFVFSFVVFFPCFFTLSVSLTSFPFYDFSVKKGRELSSSFIPQMSRSYLFPVRIQYSFLTVTIKKKSGLKKKRNKINPVIHNKRFSLYFRRKR